MSSGEFSSTVKLYFPRIFRSPDTVRVVVSEPEDCCPPLSGDARLYALSHERSVPQAKTVANGILPDAAALRIFLI